MGSYQKVLIKSHDQLCRDKNKRRNIPEVFDPENFEDDEPEDHYQMLGAAIIQNCDILYVAFKRNISKYSFYAY